MDELGLLIVGHGSRDAAANAEFEELVRRCRERRAGVTIAHAYVELAHPLVAPALDALASRVRTLIVLPLFLFSAGHVKNDVPLALAAARARHPRVRFVSAPALGVHPLLVELVLERVRAACGAAPAADTALLVVGRGSSDPDANGDFCKLVRLVGESLNLPRTFPCFIGVTRPRVPETAELVALGRPSRLVVLPYFLFAGRLLDRLRDEVSAFGARFPWIETLITPHLGGAERVLDLIDERVDQALNGARPLPCDSCQYRVPISGLPERVGGLQALLWSIRHTYTHGQAMPALHAHPLLKKHVLVCGNADCADRGSLKLIEDLRRTLRDLGRAREFRVTRTSCMGRCGEGPTVAVYPDGIWYRGVQDADAGALVHEHLLQDRIVARLVDNIMG